MLSDTAIRSVEVDWSKVEPRLGGYEMCQSDDERGPDICHASEHDTDVATSDSA